MMKIVIDIPEDLYEGIERRDGALETEYVCDELMKAVDNGTPLEQEPCEDVISRQAVLELVADYDLSMGQVVRGIHALPSVTPQEPKTGWIPVSERLPKPFEHCLWTTTDGRVIYHYCDGSFSEYTAWMPLPEPYKAESEDEK